jgi:hypothetical protein
MFFEKQSNVGKNENCKNELFFCKKMKSNCISFVKKTCRSHSRKKKQKKVNIHYQSRFRIKKLSKRRVSEDTFTVSPWPSCSAASAICSFFLEACPLTLGDSIMQNEA